MGRSDTGMWVTRGRSRAPTSAQAVPAGLALNPAFLLLADQKEFFRLCTIYLGKTRCLVLESPFQVCSRPRSQRRCAVKEKPPFVQKLSVPHPLPTRVSELRLAPAEDTTDPQGTAQHGEPAHPRPLQTKNQSKHLTELPGNCHSNNNNPASPKKRLREGKGAGKPPANRAVGT